MACSGLSGTWLAVPDIRSASTTRIALLSGPPAIWPACGAGLQHWDRLRAYVEICGRDADAPLLNTLHGALATPHDCLDLAGARRLLEPARWCSTVASLRVATMLNSDELAVYPKMRVSSCWIGNA